MQRSYIFVQVKNLIYFFTGSLIIWAGPTDYMEEDMWTNPYTKYDSNISPSLTLSQKKKCLILSTKKKQNQKT